MSALRAWLAGSIMRKSLAVVLLPLLLLGVSMIAIYQLEQQTARAEDDVRQTLQLLSDLHEAHSLLAETAAAVRGYRLVERDNFLDPYRLAEPNLMTVVDRVGAGLTDDSQRARFARVRPLFLEKLDGWRELLDPALPEAAAREQLIEGKYKLDILRAELRAMRRFEISELQQRVEVAQRLRRRNLVVTMIAALLAGLGAVAAVGWFAAGLAQRARRLAADADRLGAGQALTFADAGSDELGHVGQRLAEASRLLAERDAETRRAREEAEAANRAKTDFLSRSSHELRTPLNAILGYAQVLELDLAGRDERRHAQRIVSAGRHLLGLISELLDIARIEAGRLDLTPASVPVRAVVDEALTLVQPHAHERGVRLRIAAIADDLAVEADAQRLRQVLVNLLSNAIKFNREDGTVWLSAERDGARVRIGVRDDGPGVPPARRERLFVPFERLGAERSAVEGTGLGLAVSKRLMEAMRGEIGFDPALARGAHFWIALPAGVAAQAEAPAGAAAAAADPARPRTLLSIEDNASNQALIETLLARRPQWRLAHADTLQAARARLAQAVSDSLLPDLILLDLHLPDGRGESLIAELRAQPALAALPVVAITADATAATLAAARAAGAAAVLTKPLDVADFFATLDRLLA